jgi:hypothetical protein
MIPPIARARIALGIKATTLLALSVVGFAYVISPGYPSVYQHTDLWFISQFAGFAFALWAAGGAMKQPIKQLHMLPPAPVRRRIDEAPRDGRMVRVVWFDLPTAAYWHRHMQGWVRADDNLCRVLHGIREWEDAPTEYLEPPREAAAQRAWARDALSRRSWWILELSGVGILRQAARMLGEREIAAVERFIRENAPPYARDWKPESS